MVTVKYKSNLNANIKNSSLDLRKLIDVFDKMLELC